MHLRDYLVINRTHNKLIINFIKIIHANLIANLSIATSYVTIKF